jgi:uroporphyrinogen-III decarboxylase
MDGLRGVQYDMPYYSQRMSWPEFYEWVAKMFAGKLCAMNSPTTQVCCYGTEEEVRTMVRQFIQATLPHTTAVIMPGCEIDSYAPTENVKAMIDEARSKRYHEWLG